MRDAYAAWKVGVPAVLLVHEPFAVIAKTQCQVLGARDPLIVIYKQDAPVFETDAASEQKAHSVAKDVLKMLGA